MRESETYRVAIRGTRPLLQHRYPVKLGGEPKKSKTVVPTPQVEAEQSLFRDEKVGIYEPSDHVEGLLVAASKDHLVEGRGKKTYKGFVRSGLRVEPDMIPLLNGEGKPAKTYDIDVRRAVVMGRGITRARPKFSEWRLEFTIQNLDPANMSAPQVREFLENGGFSKGLGDYRPKFGTFEVESFEVEKPKKSR
ncbi:MAG: hypothetical protein KGJ23_07845 [Euryarchaeota archaeon]|nr:hypothetical protein [Euryarchaeota archaeon]MDE1836512.1 hypothetical protein [Euryarchaeota archaeon]MDE1879293.1 hypothetical protein [Euryarchaeota archaeon]MDE2044482.1 hypothetical protein [Thermoplasmata archaeon]